MTPMNRTSLAGLICHVTDLAATTVFYESLGFRIDYQASDKVVAYLGTFWVEFLPGQAGAHGMTLVIQVDDVDAYYTHVREIELKPTSAPATHPWGRRSFMLQDPDGYHLEFYSPAPRGKDSDSLTN
jgi:predicted lactoylglutathione lyase